MDRQKLNKIEVTENRYNNAVEAVKALSKDPQFIRQKKALEMIHKTHCYAAENDKNMTIKHRKLQSEISSNSSKIRAAIELSREDEATIAMLREELEKAWDVIKELRRKQVAQTKIPSRSVHSLTPDRNAAGDCNGSHLKEIFCLKVEKQNCLGEIKTLKAHLSEKDESLNRLQDEYGRNLKEIESLKQLREEEANEFKKKIEVLKDNLHLMRLDFEMVKKDNDKLLAEIEKYNLQIFELDEELSNKEKQIEELTLANANKSFKSKFSTTNLLNDSSLLQSDVCSISFLSENTPIKDSPEVKKLERKVKSMTSRMVKVNNLYRHIKSNLILQRRQFYESMNSLNTVRIKNDVLREEVEEKSRHCTVLLLENKKLKAEIKKFTISINLLEEIRDNYVFTMGKLEDETHNLKAELAKWKKW